MGGTTEGKAIGKDEYLFLSLYITSIYVPRRQVFLFLHDGDNCDRYR